MKLSELKQKFTEVTGVPARKAFAVIVCSQGCLEGRKMLSRADWEFAIANVEKKLTMITTEVKPEEDEDSLDADSLIAKDLICDSSEDAGIEQAKRMIKDGLYRHLAKLLHPDTTKLPKEVAKIGFHRLQMAKEQSNQKQPEVSAETGYWANKDYWRDFEEESTTDELLQKLEYLKVKFYHSGTDYAVERLYQLILNGYQEILREVLHPDTTKLSGDIAQAIFHNLTIAESKAARFREQNPCSPSLSEQAIAAKTLLCDPPYRKAVANAKREIEAGNYNHFHQLLDSNSELPQYLAKAGLWRLWDADSRLREEAAKARARDSFDPEDALF